MLKEYFSLPLYTLLHPVDGIFQMKYERKGKQSIIWVNLLLFWISYTFKNQYTAFLMNEIHPMSQSALRDLVGIVVIFGLWCIANWSITTLTNGEGKLKDIAMATAYSLTPMILVFVPATLVTHVLVGAESSFFDLAIGISIAWFLMMLFTGIQGVHDYTVTKTILTIILTFVSILVILFLAMLFTSLIQQVVVFVKSIVMEILYRT